MAVIYKFAKKKPHFLNLITTTFKILSDDSTLWSNLRVDAPDCPSGFWIPDLWPYGCYLYKTFSSPGKTYANAEAECQTHGHQVRTVQHYSTDKIILKFIINDHCFPKFSSCSELLELWALCMKLLEVVFTFPFQNFGRVYAPRVISFDPNRTSRLTNAEYLKTICLKLQSVS